MNECEYCKTKLPIERTIFYIVSIILSVVVSIVGLLILFKPEEYFVLDWLWLFVPFFLLAFFGVGKKW